MSAHVDFETLAAFVDRALASAEHATVHAHVIGCAECRAQVEKLNALNAVLAVDRDVEPSPGFDARVFDAIAAERPTALRRLRAWLKPQILAPVMATAAAVGVFVLLQPGEPSEEDLFIAQNQEMLQDLDLMQDLKNVEDAGDDFAVIAALSEVEEGGE